MSDNTQAPSPVTKLVFSAPLLVAGKSPEEAAEETLALFSGLFQHYSDQCETEGFRIVKVLPSVKNGDEGFRLACELHRVSLAA